MWNGFFFWESRERNDRSKRVLLSMRWRGALSAPKLLDNTLREPKTNRRGVHACYGYCCCSVAAVLIFVFAPAIDVFVVVVVADTPAFFAFNGPFYLGITTGRHPVDKLLSPIALCLSRC